jgi:ATP-binding cassette subfamily B protein
MGIKVKQRDITDCGAACLSSIASYYEVNLPLARIRQYAGTDRKGTNILGLLEAAEKIGFTARGVRADWESLFRITPAGNCTCCNQGHSDTLCCNS